MERHEVLAMMTELKLSGMPYGSCGFQFTLPAINARSHHPLGNRTLISRQMPIRANLLSTSVGSQP